MQHANGGLTTVSAMAGDGNNWLELSNNAGGNTAYQTLGIERAVSTVAGATYTLHGLGRRPGFNSACTKIGIYVDGVKIGSDQSTSTWSALNWQTRTFQFVGNGGSQTLRIVSEASVVSANGYGMMIDDIALTEAAAGQHRPGRHGDQAQRHQRRLEGYRRFGKPHPHAGGYSGGERAH